MSVQAPAKPLCNARTRSGGRCRKPAGAGTPHLGIGACKLHGGSTPPHLLAAANHEARVLGQIADVEPQDALLYCVRRAAGDVAWYEAKIAALEEEEAIGPPTTTLTTAEKNAGKEKVAKHTREAPAEVHIWVRLRDQALERLARFAKMAIDAGIDERRVRSAERMGDLVAALLETVFESLDVKPAERAKVLPIVQSRMLELETHREDAA
jgi:hypothetical protein